MSNIDKKEIRSDKWMRLCMKVGLPIALTSVLSLWIGWFFKIPELASLFIITAAIALAIGMIYNVRFVMLSVRQIKKKKEEGKS